MNCYEINMGSFDWNCPLNWAEVTKYMNGLIDEYSEDHSEEEIRQYTDEVFTAYCNEELIGCPKPIYDDQWKHSHNEEIEQAEKIVCNGQYDLAASLMDKELREELERRISPCDEEEFLAVYIVFHKKKYGEAFCV